MNEGGLYSLFMLLAHNNKMVVGRRGTGEEEGGGDTAPKTAYYSTILRTSLPKQEEGDVAFSPQSCRHFPFSSRLLAV